MLANIAHRISDSILLIATDFKVLWANEAAIRQAGGNIVGEFCYKATHNRQAPCNTGNDPCPLRDYKMEEGAKFARHIHFDSFGNRIDVEVGAYPVKNDAGEVDRFIHISKDITALKLLEAEIGHLREERRTALANVRRLTGLLPICMHCKKIRDDKGYWNQIEAYISEHSEAAFSHGLCPDCRKRYYP